MFVWNAYQNYAFHQKNKNAGNSGNSLAPKPNSNVVIPKPGS
jgi:hypothetical protein